MMLPLPSCTHNASCTTSNYVIDSKLLEKAKSLELSDAREALEIYFQLADQGNDEARYRCGLMLLEGRGIERNFYSAVTYLKLAAQTCADAKNLLIHITNRMEQLGSIAPKFNELNTPDDLAPKMSLKLQCAIVDLILAEKKRSDLTIAYNDLVTALSDLISIINTYTAEIFYDRDCFQVQILREAEEQIDIFLMEGVEHQNQEQGTHIGLMTQLENIPPEIWEYLGQYMSMGSNINLSETSSKHWIIHNAENSWRSRLNEDGLAKLNSASKEKLNEEGAMIKPDPAFNGRPKGDELVKYNSASKAKELFMEDLKARKQQYLLSDKKGMKNFQDQCSATPILKKYSDDPILIQRIRDGKRTIVEVLNVGNKLINLQGGRWIGALVSL